MKFKKLIFLVLIISLVSCKSNSQQNTQVENLVVKQKQTKYKEAKFPKPIGYINDYENILSKTESDYLKNSIVAFEKSTTNEIVIVTIDSITPYTDIHKFSTDLANNWAIGKIKKDNGLLIVVSKKLKKIAISTGKETEKTLTDKVCKNTINSIIIPEFKNGQYFEGLKKGLFELILRWE